MPLVHPEKAVGLLRVKLVAGTRRGQGIGIGRGGQSEAGAGDIQRDIGVGLGNAEGRIPGNRPREQVLFVFRRKPVDKAGGIDRLDARTMAVGALHPRALPLLHDRLVALVRVGNGTVGRHASLHGGDPGHEAGIGFQDRGRLPDRVKTVGDIGDIVAGIVLAEAAVFRKVTGADDEFSRTVFFALFKERAVKKRHIPEDRVDPVREIGRIGLVLEILPQVGRDMAEHAQREPPRQVGALVSVFAFANKGIGFVRLIHVGMDEAALAADKAVRGQPAGARPIVVDHVDERFRQLGVVDGPRSRIPLLLVIVELERPMPARELVHRGAQPDSGCAALRVAAEEIHLPVPAPLQRGFAGRDAALRPEIMPYRLVRADKGGIAQRQDGVDTINGRGLRVGGVERGDHGHHLTGSAFPQSKIDIHAPGIGVAGQVLAQPLHAARGPRRCRGQEALCDPLQRYCPAGGEVKHITLRKRPHHGRIDRGGHGCGALLQIDDGSPARLAGHCSQFDIGGRHRRRVGVVVPACLGVRRPGIGMGRRINDRQRRIGTCVDPAVPQIVLGYANEQIVAGGIDDSVHVAVTHEHALCSDVGDIGLPDCRGVKRRGKGDRVRGRDHGEGRQEAYRTPRAFQERKDCTHHRTSRRGRRKRLIAGSK